MILVGLIGRALAVSLLFGVLLLPTADHHLAARLPGAAQLDAHLQMVHHHGAPPVDPAERNQSAPLLLPLDAPGVGVAVPFPLIDLPLGAPPPPFAGSGLTERGHGIPPSLLEPPPLPPPVLPA